MSGRIALLVVFLALLHARHAAAFARWHRHRHAAVPKPSHPIFQFLRAAKPQGGSITRSAADGGDDSGSGGQAISFGVRLTVSLPQLRNPPRLAYCPDIDILSIALEQTLNELFRDLIAAESSALVATSAFQTKNVSCTLTSLVAYKGSPELKAAFVAALGSLDPTADLCKLLQGFCETHFPQGSGYALIAAAAVDNLTYPITDFNCEKLSFQQPLDHFNKFQTTRFRQSYFVCDDAFPQDQTQQEQEGHIIVYLGNEAPLGLPQQPIVFENARWMKALVVLIEHRYQGESLPFEDLTTEQLKWLTAEQVIEDTADILAAVRARLNIPAAVPAVVVGGSYGGMLAVYHRITKPELFAAAVSSSGPVYYAMGNPSWQATGQNLHSIAAKAANTFHGSSACTSTLRAGIARIISLGKSKPGRATLRRMFRLCTESPLETPAHALALAMHVMNSMIWFTMYNHQAVGLVGGVELLCEVLMDAAAAAAAASAQQQQQQQQQQQPAVSAELRAVAALNVFMSSDGRDWCFWLEPSGVLFVTGEPEQAVYEFTTCAQGAGGTTYMLSSEGWPVTYAPRLLVSQDAVLADCRAVFGPLLPAFRSPWFARDVQRQMLRVQGIVFTNGDLDAVAGGSLMSDADLLSPGTWSAETAFGSRRSSSSSSSSSVKPPSGSTSSNPPQRSSKKGGSQHPWLPGGGGGGAGSNGWGPAGPLDVAYVVYRNASHCSDVAPENWGLPVEPPEWQQQRRLAMQFAAEYMRKARAAALAANNNTTAG